MSFRYRNSNFQKIRHSDYSKIREDTKFYFQQSQVTGETDEKNSTNSKKNGRRDIRKVQKKLQKETKEAQKAEEERRKRVKEKQKLVGNGQFQTNKPTRTKCSHLLDKADLIKCETIIQVYKKH